MRERTCCEDVASHACRAHKSHKHTQSLMHTHKHMHMHIPSKHSSQHAQHVQTEHIDKRHHARVCAPRCNIQYGNVSLWKLRERLLAHVRRRCERLARTCKCCITFATASCDGLFANTPPSTKPWYTCASRCTCIIHSCGSTTADAPMWRAHREVRRRSGRSHRAVDGREVVRRNPAPQERHVRHECRAPIRPFEECFRAREARVIELERGDETPERRKVSCTRARRAEASSPVVQVTQAPRAQIGGHSSEPRLPTIPCTNNSRQ